MDEKQWMKDFVERFDRETANPRWILKSNAPQEDGKTMQHKVERAAPTARDYSTASVIVFDDRETFNGLGDNQDQALLTITPDHQVAAYDLARFLRDHQHLLCAPAYRMPVDHAITAGALADLAECFGLDADTFLIRATERVEPPSQALKL